jgi:hypothetical protein
VEEQEKQLLLEKASLQLLMSNEDSGAVLNRVRRKGTLAGWRPLERGFARTPVDDCHCYV